MAKLSKKEREWQAESDYMTLQRAREIQGDKSRIKGVQDYANRKAKEYQQFGTENGSKTRTRK